MWLYSTQVKWSEFVPQKEWKKEQCQFRKTKPFLNHLCVLKCGDKFIKCIAVFKSLHNSGVNIWPCFISSGTSFPSTAIMRSRIRVDEPHSLKWKTLPWCQRLKPHMCYNNWPTQDDGIHLTEKHHKIHSAIRERVCLQECFFCCPVIAALQSSCGLTPKRSETFVLLQ